MVKIENEEVLSRLQLFGLTKYEAEVYLLLLKYKALSATKLGELSKVPITRVYDIAQSLIDKGLIGIVNQNPKQYGVLPFKNAFKSLIDRKKEEFEKEIKNIEGEYDGILKYISNLPNQDAPETQDFVYMINGRKAILKSWHSVFSNLKKEIFVFSGDSVWVDEELPRLRRMINRKIDARILANTAITNNVKKAAQIGVKIRLSDNVLRGFVADRKYLYISKKFTSATKDEDYSCLITEHKAMIESIREFFLMKWNEGKEIPKQ